MAQSSFPFENVDTTETQFSQMFRTLNAGVNGTPAGTELKVSAGTGLQVSVALGQAMVRGHYYISTATELLTIGTANPSNPRIDTVVLRLDPVANSIVLAVVAGTAAASPVAPTLTQTDAGVFEFPLANVAVAAGAGTVGAITDRRVFMGKRLQSVGTSAARDIVFPAPVQGDMVWRDDLGAVETYYGLYNASTNPGGRDVAGWDSDTRQTGLVPVRASTVTIVTGTGSSNALGQVTFTGATKVSLDGVFSSRYSNYRIMFGCTGSSANTSITFRMKKNGSEYTGTQYNFGGLAMRDSGSTQAFVGAGTTAFSVAWINGPATGSGSGSGTIDVFKPATDTYQSITTNFRGADNTSGAGIFTGGNVYAGQTQDGFSLYPASGTFSGILTVYGYND